MIVLISFSNVLSIFSNDKKIIFVKSYGFITFENESEAGKALSLAVDLLVFKDSKLNVANAYKRNNQYTKS